MPKAATGQSRLLIWQNSPAPLAGQEHGAGHCGVGGPLENYRGIHFGRGVRTGAGATGG